MKLHFRSSWPAWVLSAVVATTTLGLASTVATAATAVRFSLDRRIDGLAAPFVLAANRGLFRDQNLDVTIVAGTGSQDAVARIAAGTADLALADLNVLIRYRDGTGAASIKAIFIVFNKSSYAIIARKSRGVLVLADLEGKTLGVADNDQAIRLWPALAKENGIDTGKVKIEKVGAAVREPMLSAGQLDAVTGLSFASALDLRDRGVPASDLEVFRFSELGCNPYGQAIIVNPAFAEAHPGAVAGFLRALVGGLKQTVRDPATAADAVLNVMDSGSHDLELNRLTTAIRENIVTDEVKRNGLGGISRDRFEASIDQIGQDFKFSKRPMLTDIFDSKFLPPVDDRATD